MTDAQENSNEKPQINTPSQLRRFWQRLITRRYVILSMQVILGVIVFSYLMDQIVMPLYTKHGREIKMPDVTNVPLKEAEQTLHHSHFSTIVEREIFRKDIPAGYVVLQNPMPDAIVKRGRRVYLTVSKGEKWIKVPLLIGSSERDGELKLRQLELTPGTKSFEFSASYPKGIIIAQSVAITDSVSVGDSVNFVISLGNIPEKLTVPDLIGKSYNEARRLLQESGLSVGELVYQVNSDLLPETVIRQSLAVGSVADTGTAIDLVLSEIEEGGEE